MPQARFIKGISNLDQLDDGCRLPEFAFIGRSNVGKSSLINALTGTKNLARTSKTPGRTQEINLFEMDGRTMIADLPGYGFAKVSKVRLAEFYDLITGYIRLRHNLKRIYLLADGRHGLKDNDMEMMKVLDRGGLLYQIVLTKTDQVKPDELDTIKQSVAAEITKHGAAFGEIIATSSERFTGIDILRQSIKSLS